ncbi:PAS domain-containing protein [Devosia sp. XJ19-1]|uniref:PAS domain-containing protein n=1 Tax=Devosia ureilytica TaxID=2952754 RepID=A0A9Q4AMU3_9HYPH|nr:PAS domain-containing protein [Devosia ureilytica]MCP8886664.1 PAS domain-containing protein [Devosia ureilytica]
MDLHIRELSYWKNVKSKMRLQPFVHAVESSAVPIAIADPFEPDCPLVFVNDAFLQLTGYGEDEVLGRNCRFLQGPDTRPEDRQILKQAIKNRETISHEILNYKKDGTAFWNELHMAPMLDDSGELLYFIATQVDITERVNRQTGLQQALDERTEALRDQAERTHLMAKEMTHRVRNSLALIQAMLRMQLSSLSDDTARNALVGALSRIQAIVEIQRIIEHADLNARIDIGQIVGSICEKLDHINRAHVVASTDKIEISEDLVTPVALIISELVTNAQKHAYGPEDGGIIAVTARRRQGGIELCVRDDGRGVPEGFDPMTVKGFGMRMLVQEIAHLGATLTVERLEQGTCFTVVIPHAE